MKRKIRASLLILCMCMIMALTSVMHISAADGSANVSMVVDKETANVGDTVTVTLSCKEHIVSGFGLYMEFNNELLECTEILGQDGDDYYYILYINDKGREKEADPQVYDVVENTNSDGIYSLGWVPGSDTTICEQDLITLTFVAKAAGEVTFTLNEQTSGSDAFKGVAQTETLTIKSAAPSCEHTSTKLVPNEDGTTHNVVCANAECGQTVTPNVPCTGTDDGDCTTAVTCACTNVVTAAKAAHVAGEDDGDCTTAVKCVNCEKNAVEAKAAHVAGDDDGDCTTAIKCVNCDKDAVAAKETHTGGTATCIAQAKCEVCGTAYGTFAAHTFLNNNRGTQLTPGNCNTAATYATKCDVCDYEDQTKVITGEKDPTNHTREARYVDNGDNTHSATYDCCGAPFVTNEPHDYTSGKEDNTCICGAVKAPEHDICVHDHYEITETTHQSICSCGKAIGDAEPHDYTTGPVENTCFCGAVKEIPACQHEQTIAVPNDNMTHNIICANEDCGETLRENVPCHDDDGDEYCDECRNYLHECVPAHYSNNGDGTHDVICRCQKILVDDEPHIYGEKHACQCGEIEPIGWVEIEGAWYYVYEDYTKATGLSRVPYPTVEIMGNTYAPNAADIAYAESKGREFIDKTYAWFLFEDDGKFAYDSMGYVDHGDSQGKLINGMLPWHIGLVEVAAGEYRYFAGDLVNGGNVIATGKIYVSRNTTDLDVVIGGIYLFDENGALVTGDGITDVDGVLYYLEDNRVAIEAGLVKIDGSYYYVRSGGDSAKAGQVVVGRKYWVSDPNGYFAAGMYTFDENGKMIIGAESGGREGIVEIDGVLYYYVGGVKQVGAGVVEMTDEFGETFYIYVRSNGQLATGEYWPTTTNGELERGCYDWGTDGRYYPAN